MHCGQLPHAPATLFPHHDGPHPLAVSPNISSFLKCSSVGYFTAAMKKWAIQVQKTFSSSGIKVSTEKPQNREWHCRPQESGRLWLREGTKSTVTWFPPAMSSRLWVGTEKKRRGGGGLLGWSRLVKYLVRTTDNSGRSSKITGHVWAKTKINPGGTW